MVQPPAGPVFVSYSRQDEAVMRRVVDFLRNHGIKVWVDNESLIPGTPIWEEEIEKAIRDTSAVVVVMSPDSKVSKWVRREISYADHYQKRMFPILVSGDQDSAITLRLITHQYIDFRQNEDAGLNSLHKALQHYLDELNSQTIDTERPDQIEIDKIHPVPKPRVLPWEKIRLRINLRNPITLLTLSILFVGCCGILCVNTFLGLTDDLYGLAFTPDGKTLATGGFEEIKLWQINDGKLIKSIKVESTSGLINSIAISPNGQIIASGSSSRGELQLINVSDGSLLYTLEGHIFSIESLVFSPDGTILASGSMDKAVMLWQVDDGSLRQVLHGHENPIESLAFSPHGELLASGSIGEIRLWNVMDGSLFQLLSVKGGLVNYVYSVGFSPDGNVLASGSSDDIVRLWDTNNGRILQILTGHTDDIRVVAFSPNGQILASGSDDETIRLWDIRDGTLLYTLKDRNGGIRKLIFSPDGFTLTSITGENNIVLWRVSDGILLKSMKIGN